MSDINGKAPINGAGAGTIAEPIIKVQPPRREDLQPSYARVIQPDDQDADTNGWYGSMVSRSFIFTTDISNLTRSTLLVPVLEQLEPSHAVSYVPTHTSPSRKETSASSPSLVVSHAL